MRRPLPITFMALTLIAGLPLMMGGGCPLDGLGLGTGNNSGLFNLNPRAALTVSPDPPSGVAPLRVQFDSSASTDDGVIVDRIWDFGDGSSSREISPLKVYNNNGEYQVVLTVVDDDGARTTRRVTVRVSEAPVPLLSIAFVDDAGNVVPDQTIATNSPARFRFDATGSFDPDNNDPNGLRFRIDFGDGTIATTPSVDHVYSRAGTYRVTLTVTDSAGITSSIEAFIVVGIQQPALIMRTPSGELGQVTLSPSAPLWTSVELNIESGVPYTISAGLDLDTDPNNGNDFRIDTDATDGVLIDDIPLTIPTALDIPPLSSLAGPGVYYLFAELRTDRTNPVRAYAPTSFRIVAAPGQTAATAAPVTYGKDAANADVANLVPPDGTTGARFFYNLGTLSRGDRVGVSFVGLPSYGEFFTQSLYKIEMVQATGAPTVQELFAAWFNVDLLLPLSRVGSFSSSFDAASRYRIDSTGQYFLIVHQLDLQERAPSVRIRIERGAIPSSFVPPPQRVYINLSGSQFAGVSSIAVSPPAAPFSVPAFDPNGLITDPNDPPITGFDAGVMLTNLRTTFQDAVQPYNVQVTISPNPDDPNEDVPPPAAPYLHILIDTSKQVSPALYSSSQLSLYGRFEFLDPRNAVLGGVAAISANVLVDEFSEIVSGPLPADILGQVLAFASLHQFGTSVGLLPTLPGTSSDPMTLSIANATFPPAFVTQSTPFISNQAGTLTNQNQDKILLEVIGPRP